MRNLQRARSIVDRAVVGASAVGARGRILAFIDEHPDALHRSNTTGHLTGSALVVDSAGEHVVLLHHRKLRRWLQPGGHADGDGDLARVALREAAEETGIDGLEVDPVAVDVDIHEVAPPAEGPHLHLDVRFLVVAPPGAHPVGNHESTDIRWVPVDDVDAYEPDDGLRRLIEHGLAGFRSRR